MDPAKMKVVDLRSELGALGLDTKGNKPALVERLKKALESMTGKPLPDTSILDTTNEDAGEPATPRRPAARITRRSSSTRAAPTPAKIIREEPPEPIQEEVKNDGSERYSPGLDSDSEPLKSPKKAENPPEPPKEEPKPTHEPEPEILPEPELELTPPEPVKAEEPPEENAEIPEPMETQDTEPSPQKIAPDAETSQPDKTMETDDTQEVNKETVEETSKQDKTRPLTEDEEWEQMNERLRQKEAERLEKEKQLAEEDAKTAEALSNDPIRYQRLKRKQEKKARWRNFYRSVEVTNEILTPPTEESGKGKKQSQSTEPKVPEPEIDDDIVTLSWYDSSLHQYLEAPALQSVVPLTDGAFAHAWAGARATHGVDGGRVVYEVRVGAVVSNSEAVEKEPISSGLRIGWSTEDSSLHLGEGEFSWGYESTGRAVHNGEFKDYGQALNEKDVVGVYLDLESSPCTMSYTLNGEELGAAFEFDKAVLDDKPLFPHLLTKNMCYSVNFGHDKYNMLTKKKIVRRKIEIPIEQVLEEKRAMEAEAARRKEEADRLERERKEREKKEREERQKKKREEREQKEREKKEAEAQERLERGEDAEMDSAEREPEDKEKDREDSADDTEKEERDDKPQENGDKTEDTQESTENKEEEKEKVEAMETEQTEAPENAEEAKPESAEGESGETGETGETEVTEVTEEQVYKGLVLDKRIKFVTRYLVEEELEGEEAELLAGYVLLCHAPRLLPGPRRPASKADCEVILMVGLPGVGKTHWARRHCDEHPERRYNVLSTAALFHDMQVDCKPFRTSYEGRWDAMVSKCAKCVLKLLEIARGRRRNYILDQTNVYPSAQRRKLREFEGYRRVAVAVLPDDDTYRARARRREEAGGKEVPDGAVVDMKANFTLPERCSWLDDVLFPELAGEDARRAVEGYHREAKAAGVQRDRDKRSASRDLAAHGPPNKRAHHDRRAPDRRRDRDQPRDRQGYNEDRWGGGGSRWGPRGGGGGGGGGRWGPPRDRPGAPPNRFDRGWGPQAGRGDFGRDREGFRGGRGGAGGAAGAGGRGERGRGAERFPRDRARPHDRADKRPHPHAGGGGSGSWQRGGQLQHGRGGVAPGRGANNNQQRGPNQKDGPNQNQQQNQQNQQWNQWAGGWGGWNNWNQNQGWGHWGNWNNWPAASGAAGAGAGAGGAGAAGGAAGKQQPAAQQQQWPANYSAQQWYQWQQWQQQQQQQWPGYQQSNQQAGNTADVQAWAQYYQNCNTNAANTGGGNTGTVDKK